MDQLADQFLAATRPALEAGDAEVLAAEVRRHFTTPDIAQLLQHPRVEVRQVAAIVLGLIGGADVVGVLARALHDPEIEVVQMAEHALWSVWFRLGLSSANESFVNGVRLIGEERYAEALAELDDAVAEDPEFAEARNQCAIALYLLERYEESIARCEEAVSLMPCHFGAIAGMGHGYVHGGDLAEALRCYRRARAIHPGLPGIDEHIAEIERRLHATGNGQGLESPLDAERYRSRPGDTPPEASSA